MGHDRRNPSQALVDAAGDHDVVEVRARRLLVATLSGGVYREHAVRGRVRDGRTLVVVARRHRGQAALACNRIGHPGPCEAVIVRSLHVDPRARDAVVRRGIAGHAVGRDPRPVGLGRVDDLLLAVREVVGYVRVSACDCRDAEPRGGERRVDQGDQGGEVERAGGTDVDVCVLASQLSRDDPVVRYSLEGGGSAERGFPDVRPERNPRERREDGGPVRTDRHGRFAASAVQQQRGVRECGRRGGATRFRGADRRNEQRKRHGETDQSNQLVTHDNALLRAAGRREMPAKYLSPRGSRRDFALSEMRPASSIRIANGGATPTLGVRSCALRVQSPTNWIRWVNPHSATTRWTAGSQAFGMPRTSLYSEGRPPQYFSSCSFVSCDGN